MLARQRNTQQFLGVHVELRAEAASDRRCDDAELVFGHAERDGDHHLEHVGDLRRGVQREIAAERLGDRNDRSRLHRHRDQPLLDVALADGVGRVVERPLDGAVGLLDQEVPRVRRVGAEVGVHEHPVGQGIFEVDHRLARVVGDVDRLDRVVGDRVAGGEHDGHTVTDVVDRVERDRVVRRVEHVLGDRPGARHRRGPEVGEVGAGVDGAHARHRRGGAGVDRHDLGVRIRAAQHGHVERAGHLHVVGEHGLAGQQDRVLLAQQAGADDAGGGGRIFRDGHVWTPIQSVGDVGARHRVTGDQAPADAAARTDFTML